MVSSIKKFFYFPLSYYFRFFAKIKLAQWKPYIIVVTGSSGKTSLLHLLESQIGNRAKYSHLANSTYGIPFDILGLKRENLILIEWIFLFLLAPFTIFKSPPKQKNYIAEADCDRPGEGKYLASLLRPDVTLWIGTGKTHTVNFDKEVKNGKFKKVEESIAFEFGYFLEYTKGYSIVDGDSSLVKKQLGRTSSKVEKVSIRKLKNYEVLKEGTVFETDKNSYKFNSLLPKEFFYAILMTLILLKKLDIKPDLSFKNFTMPPGRSRIFKGIKNTTIIDSTYNATPDGVASVINMFSLYPSRKKWLVLGDMIELGDQEEEEHEKLRDEIADLEAQQVILVGKRLLDYTFPKLKELGINARVFNLPKEALLYIQANITGGEVILFKGARFLEGIIEELLSDKKDTGNLVRREKIWEKRRRKFGL